MNETSESGLQLPTLSVSVSRCPVTSVKVPGVQSSMTATMVTGSGFSTATALMPGARCPVVSSGNGTRYPMSPSFGTGFATPGSRFPAPDNQVQCPGYFQQSGFGFVNSQQGQGAAYNSALSGSSGFSVPVSSSSSGVTMSGSLGNQSYVSNPGFPGPYGDQGSAAFGSYPHFQAGQNSPMGSVPFPWQGYANCPGFFPGQFGWPQGFPQWGPFPMQWPQPSPTSVSDRQKRSRSRSRRPSAAAGGPPVSVSSAESGFSVPASVPGSGSVVPVSSQGSLQASVQGSTSVAASPSGPSQESVELDDVLSLCPGDSEKEDLYSSDDEHRSSSSEQDSPAPVRSEVVPTVQPMAVTQVHKNIRTEVLDLLGPDVCPPNRTHAREPRSSALSRRVSLVEDPAVGLSLPEGNLISSAMDHMQALRSNSSQEESDLGISPTTMFSVSHIGGLKPNNYSVHASKLSGLPVKMEDSLDRVIPKPGNDQIFLSGKDRDKTERLFRLAAHSLAYADWFSLALLEVVDPKPEKVDLFDRLLQALDQAHRDCSGLLLAGLSNLVSSRRAQVLKGAPASLKKSLKDKLLTAPLEGPTLFGGVVPSILEELAKEPRQVVVSVPNRATKRPPPSSTQSSSSAKKKKRFQKKGPSKQPKGPSKPNNSSATSSAQQKRT